jgi:DNA-binding transcriptional MerR regulator
VRLPFPHRVVAVPGPGWCEEAPLADVRPSAFRGDVREVLRKRAGGAGVCFSSGWRKQTGGVEDDRPLLSIGELARRAGLPVRTIRFWSDAGVLPPAARTGGGRRLYDAACVVRLELVVTLRELGLGLADVRRVLDGQASVAEVAAVHLEALDAQIRALRLHRAVLTAVIKRAAGNEEMTLMNKLARMSAAERRLMIDEFLDDVFGGLHPSPAQAPRWNAAPNLPDDPSPEQVDAWVEIAELVSDPGFRQRIRQVMDLGARFGGRIEVHAKRTRPRPGHPPGHLDHAGAGAGDGLRDLVHEARENAAAAVLRGCPPDSAEAAQVASRLLEPVPGEHPVDRGELIAGLEAATDPRIDRYWQLTATINGWPPFPSPSPSPSRTQGDLWLLAALRALR